MQRTQKSVPREYLDLLVTKDTLAEGLLVRAGTRLLGLRAPTGGRVMTVAVQVASGSIRRFSADACRATPKMFTACSRSPAACARQACPRELASRQWNLVWAALEQVQLDKALSRVARVERLYQTLAQTVAVGGRRSEAKVRSTFGCISPRRAKIHCIVGRPRTGRKRNHSTSP